MDRVSFLEFIASTCVILGLTFVLESRRFARKWRLGNGVKRVIWQSYALMIAALIILITFSYSVFALVPEGSSWKFKSATIAMILIFMFVIYLPVTKIFSIGSADLNKAYRVSKKRKAELEAIMQELDAGETRLQEVADELSVLEKTGFSELDRLLSEKKATVGDIYAGLQIEKKASETRKTFEQSMLKLNDFRQRTQAMLDGKRTEQSIAAFQAELDATTFS